MLGLSGYGSSDDSDADDSKPVISSAMPSSSASSEAAPLIQNISKSDLKSYNINVAEKGKKKKLDISFLPKNIQDALTGAGDLDSDDDEIPSLVNSRLNNQGPTSSNLPSSNPSRSSLLDILPKPKLATNSHANVNNVLPRVQLKQIDGTDNESDKSINHGDTLAENENDRKRMLSLGIAELSKTSSSLEKGKGKVENMWIDEDENSEDEDENEEAINEEVDNGYSGLVKPDVSVKDSLIGVSSSSFIPKINPRGSEDVPTSFDNVFNTHDPASTLTVGPMPDHRPSYDYNTNESTIDAVPGGKRRRDRELEQQLLSGDTSVLDAVGAKTVEANNSWNRDAYTDQMQREQDMKNAYNLTVNGMGINQPTKLQNRRHQINSLVFNAAETEMKMLELKAKRTKTRGETQAKYGW